MEQQNDQTLEEISIVTPNDLVNNEKDFLAFYQSSFIKIEFQFHFLYIIQMFEMFFITIISTLSFLPFIESDSSKINFFNSFISFCSISPSLFSSNSVSYFVIGNIILLILSLFGLTAYIGITNKKDNTLINPCSLKLWAILLRFILPFPSIIIGCYFGYYFFELTTKVCINQLALIVITGTFWCWSIISSNLLYNSNHFKRKNDICQIHQNYVLFECINTILPMVQAIMPYVFSIFISSNTNAIFYGFISSFLSFIIIVFILLKQPYHDESMNQYVTFLQAVKMPFSFLWMIEKTYPNKFELYLLFCLIFSIGAFILIKVLSNCCPCFHRITLINNPSSQIIQDQSQDNIKSENNESEVQLDYQFDNDDHNQPLNCDPFINCPYPFNLISLTYHDIIIGIYLVSGIVFMILLNGAAAQRMPISKVLPDLVQDHFFIADYLRTKVANSPFQISNILIFIQIFLLLFFLFFTPQYLNLRRFAFLYGTLCFIRGVSFLITSLPAPCTGYSKCPCADPKTIKLFNEGSVIKIAFTWLFGLGIFLTYPQCGDLIISGHTMWLWLTSRTLCSVISSYVPKPFNWLGNSFLIALTLIAMFYIILSRNHYSIDVWFGFLLTDLLFNLYNALSSLAVQPHSNDSLLLKIIKFVETRPKRRVLIQTRIMLAQNDA